MDEFIKNNRAKLGKVKRSFAGKRKDRATDTIPTFAAHLNSPVGNWQKQKTLIVAGWLLPNESYEVKGLRIVNNGKVTPLPYGAKRYDVAKAYPSRDKRRALHSGFHKEIKYEEGYLAIEVDLGAGWQEVRSFTVNYSPENLVEMIYDPNYAQRSAEHSNLQANKRKYYYEKPLVHSYTPHEDDTKLVAFYLPQFHPIKENDKAWGKGFTEWTNVVNAKPRFVGHNQPLLPTDLGYYDLRLAESIESQIELAKKHGIHGFCFYYYWFSSSRLLERPLDIFLSHKEWDFNFMIAWANENWSKRWDGLDEDVIIAQKYLKDDPLNFIKDVEPILLDERYIRIDGKPVLVVYRGAKLDNPKRYIDVWRKYFRDKHATDLHILFVLGLDAIDPRPLGFDAGIEFEPLTIAKRIDFSRQKPLPPAIFENLLDKDFVGGVADYRQVALRQNRDIFDFPTYRSVMPSWDNDARKKGKGPTVFYGANQDIYAKWLDETLSDATEAKKPLVFVNAWNEWAEGAVLEPNVFTGNGYLNRTTQLLAKYSHSPENAALFPLYDLEKAGNAKIAVHVHIFYEKEWQRITKKLRHLEKASYRLFVTLTERCSNLEEPIKEMFPGAVVYTVPNRGRDVLPFLYILPRIREAGYEYVLKLHTKRSLHREDGKEWFDDLLGKLLPSTSAIGRIMSELEQGSALVGPSQHFISLDKYIGSNYDHIVRQLSNRYGDKKTDVFLMTHAENGYFAGSMFWARIDAFDAFVDMPFIVEEFESEKGQIDGTLAHAVERMFSLLPVIENKKISQSDGRRVSAVSADDIDTDYKYVR